MVTRLMSAARVPKVAIAIVDKGEVALVRCYGYRDVAAKAALVPRNHAVALVRIRSTYQFSNTASGQHEPR
ncbi:MAG: hypothetical protein ABI647_18015 [Gemmatimonadota bacterium]